MSEAEYDSILAARALLAELTGALFTTDPQRRQSIIPAAARRAELRSEVKAATAAIVGLDEQGVITAFNPAAEQLFGHTGAAVLGQSAALLFTTAGEDAAEAIPEDRAGLVVIRGSVVPGELLLSICDNGEGILPENLEKIFEPPFTTKTRGTGLGLAIVSNIVKRHGGTLQVQSRRRVGTTFTIHLPRARDPEPG